MHVRVKTTGVAEIRMEVSGVKLNLIDVGPMCGKWRKWIQCFEDVTCLLYVVSLSEYDKINEDSDTNCMHQSLKEFNEVCNYKCFRDTTTILFLTDLESFKERVSRENNLNVCFEDYDGSDGVQFIANKFLALNQNPVKTIYVHAVNTADPDCAIPIFNAVKDQVLRVALYQAKILYV